MREAIYDGPFDLLQFETQPVVLEKQPNMTQGDAFLEPVQLVPGDWLLDKDGKLTTLDEGVAYYPTNCNDLACAQIYSGGEPVTMDHMVVRFKLKPGILWSDGTPLTARDSEYSFQVAKALYPRFRPTLINQTQSYSALDEVTVEWRGIPGYLDSTYDTNFFSPLPYHAWSGYRPEELLTQEISSRLPRGWGAYILDEWVPGDHIALHKNPLYFRLEEGLPAFDSLIFRFVPDGEQALEALMAGECDLVDKSAISEEQNNLLAELEQGNRVAVAYENGSAWEHILFGIQPANPGFTSRFTGKELRQAIARCIDRDGLASALFAGQSQRLDSYVPPMHPLSNPDIQTYTYDPQKAAEELSALGWVDEDQNPQTPRIALGVPGVVDGTPLTIEYLTISGEVRRQAAESVQASLAGCGVQLNLTFMDSEQFFAPGPDGPVFGRRFEMAQFGWETMMEPPCFIYTSQEIPGPYPEYPKGWGGANAAGYTNPDFDQACQSANNALPDQPEYAQGHAAAQAIFAEDLPAIPLYLIPSRVAMRMDMCGVILDPSAGSALWNIESFNYGEACESISD